MAHVAQYKKDIVANLVKLMQEYPIIGTVNMENLPAAALQKMVAQLRGKASLTMTKRRLMKLAFLEAEKTKKGVSALVEHLKGMPALLFTKENPFKIYKLIKKSKSPAPAKPGQIAQKDIEVKAGSTQFLPGPIIGELSSLGIKTAVENGKVAIKEDRVVVKEGEEINAKAAGILTRLGIEPMEVGLDITAVYENGVIYDKKILDIDEEKFIADLTKAAGCARNLAMEIAYATKDTITSLIVKSYLDSKALGQEVCILVPGVIDCLLVKAQNQAEGLKQTVNVK